MPTAVIGIRGTTFFSYYMETISGALFEDGEGYCYSVKLPDIIRYIQKGESMLVADPLQPPVIRPFSTVEIQKHRKDTTPVPSGKAEGEIETVMKEELHNE